MSFLFTQCSGIHKLQTTCIVFGSPFFSVLHQFFPSLQRGQMYGIGAWGFNIRYLSQCHKALLGLEVPHPGSLLSSLGTLTPLIIYWTTDISTLQIASVFYYLCVVTLQYVAPIVLCLFLSLMFKTLGKEEYQADLFTGKEKLTTGFVVVNQRATDKVVVWYSQLCCRLQIRLWCSRLCCSSRCKYFYSWRHTQ